MRIFEASLERFNGEALHWWRCKSLLSYHFYQFYREGTFCLFGVCCTCWALNVTDLFLVLTCSHLGVIVTTPIFCFDKMETLRGSRLDQTPSPLMTSIQRSSPLSPFCCVPSISRVNVLDHWWVCVRVSVHTVLVVLTYSAKCQIHSCS